MEIISALRSLRNSSKLNTTNNSKYDNFLTTSLETPKPCQIVYKKFITKKGTISSKSQQKWLRDCNQIENDMKLSINWSEAYQLTFHFKFLHQWVSTSNFLSRIGFKDRNKCTFCEHETEDLIHLFWTCNETITFVTSLTTWLQSCQITSKETSVDLKTALGLRSDTSNFKLQINYCWHYVWRCKTKEITPKLECYLRYLKSPNCDTELHTNISALKKWEPLLDLWYVKPPQKRGRFSPSPCKNRKCIE